MFSKNTDKSKYIYFVDLYDHVSILELFDIQFTNNGFLCSVSCEVFKHTLFHVTIPKVYFIVTTLLHRLDWFLKMHACLDSFDLVLE